MLHLKNDNRREHFEVLFDSLPRLKNYAPLLHPKIETLLAFHQRPLTVVIQSPHLLPEAIQDERGAVSVRIVQDSLTQHLIQQVDAPIVSIAASAANEPYPVNFGTIRSDFIQGVDYVMKMRQKDLIGQARPSVKVQLDEQEDFIFLRE